MRIHCDSYSYGLNHLPNNSTHSGGEDTLDE